MGKPAARLGDMTAHGGTVVVGKPTVLIGKMPAATLGDMHVCPMVTGVVPHVGGPISLGSMGVLICKTPAARVSDMAVCVGPPSMPVMGCFTVLIGEAGSGGGGASAASAAAAASSAKNGPKAIKPFDLGEPPEPRTENHYVECRVEDSAGLPLGGIPYKLKDPAGNDIVGMTSAEGRIRHDGYAQAGSFQVEFPALTNAKWPKAKAKPGEQLALKCDAEGFKDGAEATVVVFEERDGGSSQRSLAYLKTKVSGKKVEARWALTKPDYPVATGEKPVEEPRGKTEYFFFVCVDGLIAVSDRATFAEDAEIKLVDEGGKALPDTAFEMHLHDGSVRKGKVDKDGKAKEKDVPVGPYVIVLPEIVITAKAPGGKDAKGGTGAGGGGAGAGSTSGGTGGGATKGSGDADKIPGPLAKKVKLLFPLKKRPELSYTGGKRYFAAERNNGKRKHAGVDLIAKDGTEIRAVADGTVKVFKDFYLGTWYLEVDHGDYTVRYGEVSPKLPPDVKVGGKVKRGQVIAYVGLMTSGSHMLHFEMYDNSASGNLTQRGRKPFQRRADLVNPTQHLDEAAME